MAKTTKRAKTPLSDGPDWTFDMLEQYESHIDRIAKNFKLDTYPNQIEVILPSK